MVSPFLEFSVSIAWQYCACLYFSVAGVICRGLVTSVHPTTDFAPFRRCWYYWILHLFASVDWYKELATRTTVVISIHDNKCIAYHRVLFKVIASNTILSLILPRFYARWMNLTRVCIRLSQSCLYYRLCRRHEPASIDDTMLCHVIANVVYVEHLCLLTYIT
jgi:hypothetical protein